MRGLRGGTRRLTVPVGALISRLSLFLLFSSTVALIVLSRAENATLARFTNTVVAATAPVLDVLSRPVDAFHDLRDWAGNLVFLHDENRRLREQNARLRQWEAVARRLEQENDRFRAFLGVTRDQASSSVITRIIGDSGGSYVRAALLNGGRRDGVREGQAVVGARGLVGHVVAVGRNSARALLLTDLNSRIPVMVEDSGFRAILTGNNSTMPRLSFLEVGAQVRPGDRIVTSGDGGLLPPGIAVGQVVASGAGDRVKLFADADRLEFVRVLTYVAPAVETEAAVAGGTPQ